MLEGNVDVRSEKKEVKVVERWADWNEGEWTKGVERKGAEKLRMGGDGKLELVARIGKDEWCQTPARLFWHGDNDMGVEGKGRIEVRVKVRNASKKHVSLDLDSRQSEGRCLSAVDDAGLGAQARPLSPATNPTSERTTSSRRSPDRHRHNPHPQFSRHRL
jgi:hypothetical protein